MRDDHLAYQQATRVAGFGLLIQLAIALVLFVFGQSAGDTTFTFASVYVAVGSLAWLALVVTFHQHKLERLEALEQDELTASRGEALSVFDESEEEIRVAARRLRFMHKWLMPIASLALAGLLLLLAMMMFRHLRNIDEGMAVFGVASTRGWAVAICIGFALVAFIFSRFVAGMAKQAAWQNLRAGAGFMVGNALVLVAVAIGFGFLYFENDAVLGWIAWAIPAVMVVIVLEIVLNFVLNLYRPRVPGEVPRPAFDSRLLSFFSAPDSVVRSLNEAVNYQFGFDITSSWGYQLLLRSFASLAAIGIVVLVLLNTLVVIEPHQQAVKLAGGEIVGEDRVHDSGLLWKLPWPLESARVEDVARIREIALTARVREGVRPVYLWSDELQTNVPFDPFLVHATSVADEVGRLGLGGVAPPERLEEPAETEDGEPVDEQVRQLSRSFSLVDAEILMQYRIRSTKTGADRDGLIDYLKFASDDREPRDPLTEREELLRGLALRAISRHLADFSLAELLARKRAGLSEELREQVQQSLDQFDAGVEVVSISIPTLRPHGGAAASYVDLAISIQAREQLVAEAEATRVRSLTYLAGSPEMAVEIAEAIEHWKAVRQNPDAGEEMVEAARDAAERLIRRSGGNAAQIMARAEGERWVREMKDRTEASRVARELPSYRAAPELYRQRQIMGVLMEAMTNPYARIFVVGIDPSRLDFAVDLEQLNVFNPQDALPDSGDVNQ